MRRILLFIGILLLYLSANLSAQPIEEIKKSDRYLWGEGIHDYLERADEMALKGLISQISVKVRSETHLRIEEKDGEVEEFYQNMVQTYANTKLTNAQRKVDEEIHAPKIYVIRYMEKSKVTEIFEDRKKKIKLYTDYGVEAEEENRIGDALRNYYWALVLLRSHPDRNKITHTFAEKEEGLLVALQSRIDCIFTYLDIVVDDVLEDTETKTKIIKLRINHRDKPVQNLDFIYHLGDDWSKLIGVKNGMAALEFYDSAIDLVDNIRIKIEYRYFDKSRIDSEVRDVMEQTQFVPLKNSHFEIPLETEKAPAPGGPSNPNYADTKFTAASRELDIAFYSNAIKKLLTGINTRDHSSIRSMFTDEGYNSFQQIIGYGNAIVMEQDLSIELIQIRDQVMARSVPMLFTFNRSNKKFIEDIVFTFNENNKVSAVSFALSDVAVDDIMNKPDDFATREKKAQIIQFMEYYKTAYCLKDIDFVNSVFADNALIIVGRVLKEDKPIDDMYKDLGDQVEYIRYSKREYIKNLRMVFSSNEFINIQFENNNIKKINKGDDKVYGIQIYQNYYSTNYADKGYLFLMMDLTNMDEPKIYVRSWQPKQNPDGSVVGLENFHF